MTETETPPSRGAAAVEHDEPAAPPATSANHELAATEEHPQASRGLLIGLYLLVLAAASALVRSRGRHLPRPAPTDVVLFGLSVFRLSRLVTKDKVLQPLREPFVEESTPGADGEVNSQPTGTGLRRAVGELLTCPFCASIWLATGLATGFALVPRAARLVWATLASVALSDAAQHAYGALRQASAAPPSPAAVSRS
jgi:hypothetical protein